jgi:hypothetical protein
LKEAAFVDRLEKGSCEFLIGVDERDGSRGGMTDQRVSNIEASMEGGSEKLRADGNVPLADQTRSSSHRDVTESEKRIAFTEGSGRPAVVDQ